MGENVNDIILDDSIEETQGVEIKGSTPSRKSQNKQASEPSKKELINCLRNETVTVRFLKRDTGFITNPKHVMYGGMAETATRTYTTPLLNNGSYKNVLTNDEKDFLEAVMGLDKNALSVYLKENNFWENLQVRLTKQDTILDLSTPMDYIKYKILLANSDSIATNMQTVSTYPKATYQFVLIAEKDELNLSKSAMDISMEASVEFSKIIEMPETLRLIVETMEGKALSINTKSDFLKTQAFRLMQANPDLFVRIAKDPTLPSKMLIKQAVENGLIRKRGDFYYLADNNQALADGNDEPTLSTAVTYINSPQRQQVKFMLEAKLKALKS